MHFLLAIFLIPMAMAVPLSLFGGGDKSTTTTPSNPLDCHRCPIPQPVNADGKKGKFMPFQDIAGECRTVMDCDGEAKAILKDGKDHVLAKGASFTCMNGEVSVKDGKALKAIKSVRCGNPEKKGGMLSKIFG